MISLIVAAATNNVIGVNGKLPWHLSDDLRRFKAITMGKPIIMGRKTCESIGRPLPGRQNIVITTQADFVADGCDVVASSAAAITAAAITAAAITAAGNAAEIMIIGGGQIYALFLPKADRIYLTRVNVEVKGDAYFPVLDDSIWIETARDEAVANEANDFDVSHLIYSRRE